MVARAEAEEGLRRNLELGLVDYNPPAISHALQWFEQLWRDATDYKQELRRLLFPDPGLMDPQTVYLRALLELYGDELDDEPGPRPAAVQLASFQQDGYERARRILRRHHGVVYADGVGTGKTEVGLAFIEEYALMGMPRNRVLAMFRSPFFAGAHAVFAARGEEFVARLVDQVFGPARPKEAT